MRGMTSGTASSVAFTPLQGLEIVNPMAAEKKVQEVSADQRWPFVTSPLPSYNRPIRSTFQARQLSKRLDRGWTSDSHTHTQSRFKCYYYKTTEGCC